MVVEGGQKETGFVLGGGDGNVYIVCSGFLSQRIQLFLYSAQRVSQSPCNGVQMRFVFSARGCKRGARLGGYGFSRPDVELQVLNLEIPAVLFVVLGAFYNIDEQVWQVDFF